MSTAAELVRSAHALPCAAVTAFATVLALVAGNGVGTCVLLAVAVFGGQLLIGWTNDRLDATADRQSGRADKPLAVGAVSPRAIDAGRVTAGAVTVGASLGLGWPAGLLHLGAVASGLLYDLGLKRTVWSWLPYAFSFGSLPVIATLATPERTLPGAWVVAAAALLGLAAHLTNAAPDVADDLASGTRNVVTRLGVRTSLALTSVLLAATTVLVALGPAGPTRWWGWAGLAVAAVLLAGATVPLLHPAGGRSAFYAVVAFVPVDLLLVVLSRTQLR